MTIRFVTVFRNITEFGYQAGDTIVINRTGTLFSDGVPVHGLSGTNLEVIVEGLVFGPTYGMNLSGPSVVTIGATGTVAGSTWSIFQAGANAIVNNNGHLVNLVEFSGGFARLNNTGIITAEGAAVQMSGNESLFSNSGAISGLVSVTGQASKVVNTGTITAVSVAIVGGSSATAIENAGSVQGHIDFGSASSGDRLFNSGEIFGTVYNMGAGSLIDNDGMIVGLLEAISMFGAGSRVNNGGTIRAVDTAINMTGNSSFLTNTGIISGNSDTADTTIAAVSIGSAATSTWVVNYGTITGYWNAIRGGAGTNYVFNYGQIDGSINFGTGTSEQLTNTGDIFGSVSGFSSGARVNNSGTIAVTLTMSIGPDVVRNDGFIQNIDFGGGAGGDTFINTGTIGSNVLNFGQASYIRNSGNIVDSLTMSTGADFLHNTGRIASVFSGNGPGGDRIVNLGLIDGNLTMLGSGAADITNKGSMLGTLQAGTGADVVRNAGLIRLVNLGDGSDLFTSDKTGVVELSVVGGAGNDTIKGGDADDLFFGDAGADTLAGRAGDDNLVGGGADDLLSGGDGDDVLQGGSGADRTSGGAGADTFVSAAPGELKVAGPFDTITDFARGSDVIDLSGMPGTLLFNGTGAFTGGGTGSVIYSVADTTATVQVDANGDGVSDGRILLLQITALATTDFLL